MENIYSLFYTGQQNPYGYGAWDSKGGKLKHSSSLPYLTNYSKSENKNKNTHNSNNSKKINLPNILSRPGSQYYKKKSKKRHITKSSSESSFQYDRNKNRNELSDYVNDINNNINEKLKNDNIITQQKLNNIKNNYNEIKTL